MAPSRVFLGMFLVSVAMATACSSAPSAPTVRPEARNTTTNPRDVAVPSNHGVTPVQLGTIKTRAIPRRDYAFFDTGKDYPAEARALGIEGAIRVRLVVDEYGNVKSRVLLNKLGHGLDELALQRAGELEFEPAHDTDDKAVASAVVWTFNFRLDSPRKPDAPGDIGAGSGAPTP